MKRTLNKSKTRPQVSQKSRSFISPASTIFGTLSLSKGARAIETPATSSSAHY